MEDLEVILSGMPNIGINSLKANLIITNKRLIFLHHFGTQNTTEQIVGDIDKLFSAIKELSKNNPINQILDEIIESNMLNRSFYYKDIKEARIKNSTHWWNVNAIVIKGTAIMGDKKLLKFTDQYVISKDQCKQLSDELITVEWLKEKLSIM
ncbi:MAG: hypothetical protein JW856_00185 [Dehalococcoidales bacterium]|nr:hypothetical protein [Dehalococcoidales bacterium]